MVLGSRGSDFVDGQGNINVPSRTATPNGRLYGQIVSLKAAEGDSHVVAADIFLQLQMR